MQYMHIFVAFLLYPPVPKIVVSAYKFYFNVVTYMHDRNSNTRRQTKDCCLSLRRRHKETIGQDYSVNQ